jgi:hypothetical protein
MQPGWAAGRMYLHDVWARDDAIVCIVRPYPKSVEFS